MYLLLHGCLHLLPDGAGDGNGNSDGDRDDDGDGDGDDDVDCDERHNSAKKDKCNARAVWCEICVI